MKGHFDKMPLCLFKCFFYLNGYHRAGNIVMSALIYIIRVRLKLLFTTCGEDMLWLPLYTCV